MLPAHLPANLDANPDAPGATTAILVVDDERAVRAFASSSPTTGCPG